MNGTYLLSSEMAKAMAAPYWGNCVQYRLDHPVAVYIDESTDVDSSTDATMTFAMAGHMLGCSSATVRNLIIRKTLPSLRHRDVTALKASGWTAAPRGRRSKTKATAADDSEDEIDAQACVDVLMNDIEDVDTGVDVDEIEIDAISIDDNIADVDIDDSQTTINDAPLSLAAAAKLFGCTSQTITNWLDAGKLASLRRADVESLLLNRTTYKKTSACPRRRLLSAFIYNDNISPLVDMFRGDADLALANNIVVIDAPTAAMIPFAEAMRRWRLCWASDPRGDATKAFVHSLCNGGSDVSMYIDLSGDLHFDDEQIWAYVHKDGEGEGERVYEWSRAGKLHSRNSALVDELIGIPEPTTTRPGSAERVEVYRQRARRLEAIFDDDDAELTDADGCEFDHRERVALTRGNLAELIRAIRPTAFHGVTEERVIIDEIVDGKLVKGKPGRWTARDVVGGKKYRCGGYPTEAEALRGLRRFRERGAYQWSGGRWMAAAWCDAPGWDRYELLGVCESEAEAKARSAEFLEKWKEEREEEFRRLADEMPESEKKLYAALVKASLCME